MITTFKGKPPKDDWKKLSCRINYALMLAAEKTFNRKFKVVKIVWDKEGGYPEHSWGTEQFTVRPVWPGFGCDGTSDGPHHARAYLLLKRLGIDADSLYRKAYADEKCDWVPSEYLKSVSADVDYILPDGNPGRTEIQDILYDLYQLNNRSYVYEICEELERRGFDVPNYDSPSLKFPEPPLPSSDLPVKVIVYKASDNTEYYISDSILKLSLFEQVKPIRDVHIKSMWWDDPALIKQLEAMRSDRSRRHHMEMLIKCGRAPKKVMEYANKFFTF